MVEVQAKFREEMIERFRGGEGGESRQRGQRGQGGEGGQARQRGEGGASRVGGAAALAGAFGGGGQRGGGGGRRGGDTIWYKDVAGELKMMAVRTGVSDGINTEIMPLREEEIPEGREIISKVLTPSTNQNSNQNLFGGRGGPGGGRGRGIF